VSEISLPQLPPQAHHVHVIPSLAFMSLLAMGPLCDAGCMIEFDATTIHVWLQEQLVLQGGCALPGLWIFHLLMLDTSNHPSSQQCYYNTSEFSHWST
jgi:hypothetical protein